VPETARPFTAGRLPPLPDRRSCVVTGVAADFSAQAQRAGARGWPVERLQADHNPQWSAPEQLVEMRDRSACPCGD